MADPKPHLRVALVGHPNVGKSSLFNALTGASAHVGNYPGVTVRVERGLVQVADKTCEVLDLPGTYRLDGLSPDEAATGEAISSLQPDVLVLVVDATDLERHLFLALEAASLGIPVAMAANHCDELRRAGLELDADVLARQLGMRVTKVSATSRLGLTELVAAIGETAGTPKMPARPLPGDSVLHAQAHEAARAAIRRAGAARVSRTDRADRWLAHPTWGIVAFLVVMYAVFELTFRLGSYPSAGIEWLLGAADAAISHVLPPESVLRSLLVEGILGGAGTVLMFVPNLAVLFLAIALLEDTGYMARVALVMDRSLRWLGLGGKSLVPLLLGFGCSVPAIMATRTIEDRRSRLTTLLVVPLMSCGARLPIYSLLIGTFFMPSLRGPMLLAMYLVGIMLAMGGILVLRRGWLRGVSLPLVIELPPYRWPMRSVLVRQVTRRTGSYVTKAFTLILGTSVVMWAISRYPQLPPSDGRPAARQAQVAHSYLGRVARFSEPIMRPIGLDWTVAAAVVSAAPAKEVFVAQMGIIHGPDAGDNVSLAAVLRSRYTPLQAVSIMLLCLVGTPCVATLVATARETGSWRMAGAQWLGLTALGWIVSLLVYQVGRQILY